MADAIAAEREQGKSIEPTVINLRTQLVKTGRSRELLAEGEHMTFRIHCYAPGIGEHGLHAHLDEEHIFIVLDGCARFSGINGPLPPMTKNQGIALPKGCFYEFANAGDTPLVMIRFGAGAEKVLHGRRLTPDGKPIAGRSADKALSEPTFIDGAFFE